MAVYRTEQAAYRLMAFLADGSQLDLTPAVISMEWSESEGELAARARLTLANIKTSAGDLVGQKLPLCTRLKILADGQVCFSGLVWDWTQSASSSKTFSITAYDNFIYAQKSKDNNYFRKGKSTAEIVRAICKKWNIPLRYSWVNHTHKKTAYRGNTIADQIVSTLEEARKKTGVKYVAQMWEDTLCVKARGQNEAVCLFEPASTMELSHRMTLDNFVTRVIIGGKEKNGKIPVKATLNGQTQYGILQEIVSSSGSNVKEARKQAEELLKERGERPESTIQLSTPDVPSLRKGDRVRLRGLGAVGDGDYFVLSVSHSAAGRTMSLTLDPDDGRDQAPYEAAVLTSELWSPPGGQTAHPLP